MCLPVLLLDASRCVGKTLVAQVRVVCWRWVLCRSQKGPLQRVDPACFGKEGDLVFDEESSVMSLVFCSFFVPIKPDKSLCACS